MKLKATVFVTGTDVAPGALRSAARNIPVTVGFDGSQVVGSATVFIDGTAELELNLPAEHREGAGEGGAFGLGYVVEQERRDGDVRVIERLRPISVSIAPDLFKRLQSGGR